MPRRYVRKTERGSWTEESLVSAADEVRTGQNTLWKAAMEFGIPYRTLQRRIKKNNLVKGNLGPSCCLGEYEAELVVYIKKLESVGYPPSSLSVRQLAYSFAEKKTIKHRFNCDHKLAGRDWFNSFLRRNPTLTIRKAEGVSFARGLGMNRQEVSNYFDLLKELLDHHGLVGMPSKIFNMDESGLQLNNDPGKVVATKGAKDVHTLTSAEKGETISVIACCNAEGRFLPPYCVFKGIRKKNEFEDGMPPGSVVKMGEKSAYVNSEIFLEWLKEHSCPRKEPGKVLLILDGHSSHCSDVRVLDFAFENDILLLCLPSHTTHYLQPLDRSFFKPLKSYWKKAVSNWIFNHPGRRLTRYQFGGLLNNAWTMAATIGNGVSGFKACGIFPFNPEEIPDHAFSISDSARVENVTICHSETMQVSQSMTSTANNLPATPATTQLSEPITIAITSALVEETNINTNSTTEPEPIPGCSNDFQSPSPSSFESIRPIPRMLQPNTSARKQHAKLLTNKDHIEELKRKKFLREEKQAKKKAPPKKKAPSKKKTKIIKKKTISKSERESSASADSFLDLDDSTSVEEDTDSYCGVCELYFYDKNGPRCDWVQCSSCKKWMHEDCCQRGDCPICMTD